MISTPFSCAQAIYTGVRKNPSVEEASGFLPATALSRRRHFDATAHGLLYFAPSIDEEDPL
jgi:hypothetical protein